MFAFIVEILLFVVWYLHKFHYTNIGILCSCNCFVHFFRYFLIFFQMILYNGLVLCFIRHHQMDFYKYFLVSLSSLFNGSVYSCGHLCSSLQYIRIKVSRPRTDSTVRAEALCFQSGNTRLRRMSGRYIWKQLFAKAIQTTDGKILETALRETHQYPCPLLTQ